LPRTIKPLVAALTASAAATITAVALPASAATRAATPAPVTATTQIANRPDSGVQGNNWALDNFTRVATLTRIGEVAASNCPSSDTGHCYLWDFTISDTGKFTTIAGQLAPRTGTLDRKLTGPMTGGTSNGQFYSSWKTAKASRVPTTEDDQGLAPTGRKTTTNWVEQFFGASAVFNSAANPGGPDLGSKAGWTYTLNFGSNKQCPNDAYRWVDAAAGQWGSLPVDGNILTPNAADCT
jgi:hypothetical protein